jgi:predicted 3-demethylubiquinone-9 3-methyltransferase (glyoxalase superfamily)
MQKFTPCLWFDSNAEEAVQFYTSIFDKSKVTAAAPAELLLIDTAL